jgi:hypothetical protein
MLKEHEKFWAFMALLIAVVLLVIAAQIWPPEKEIVARVIDAAVAGLMLALGAATNALFRSNTPSPSMEVPLDPAGAPTMTTAPAPPPPAAADDFQGEAAWAR